MATHLSCQCIESIIPIVKSVWKQSSSAMFDCLTREVLSYSRYMVCVQVIPHRQQSHQLSWLPLIVQILFYTIKTATWWHYLN